LSDLGYADDTRFFTVLVCVLDEERTFVDERRGFVVVRVCEWRGECLLVECVFFCVELRPYRRYFLLLVADDM
jgi:hypothetical protein